MSACKHCGKRWAQKQGLCRTCERALGVDNRSIFERERDQVQARKAVNMAPVAMVEQRQILVGGREYVVVWDGTMRAPLNDLREEQKS